MISSHLEMLLSTKQALFFGSCFSNASTQTLALKELLSTSLPMLQGARTPTNDFEMELSLNGLARIATQEKDLR